MGTMHIFATHELTAQLSRWCYSGHCCPYKKYKGVAMGMARAGGLIWFRWTRSCSWLGRWLVMLAVFCYGLCLVRNSKIKLTFFSTEKTYWVLRGTTLKPNLKIRLWETYNDKVFLRTFESEESDLSSWDGPWAICCFTFALGAFGTLAITG